MKVLHISKFYPPVMGGIESVAWELAEGLNRAGLRTDVLCSNQRAATVHDHVAGGYDVVRAGSLGMALSTSMAPAMLHQVRRMAAGRDVVHVHMPDPMAAFAIWAARPKAALVVHWHSDVIRQRLALKLYDPLQQWLLARAQAIVATSQAYADASAPLRRWQNKVAVIPIGISDNHSEACSQKAQAIRQRFRGRRIVFSLGRMTYYKGFDVLIDAAATLPEDCVVMIGGDGELLEHYKTLVRRRGLAGKVHLLGHIPDDDLASHFEACDVFCLSSIARAEAYGVAMLEAMVMGKPIVATDIKGSGVPWVNVDGGTGINVPAGEPRPLAEALTRLLEDAPLRETLGRAARQRYLQNFNAELMTRRTIELYQRL
ncbi:MAG: glycosyltransferase [Burkholderiales bacterium]|nr:glycosyltransferase [Burkholderiales bacterium]